MTARRCAAEAAPATAGAWRLRAGTAAGACRRRAWGGSSTASSRTAWGPGPRQAQARPKARREACGARVSRAHADRTAPTPKARATHRPQQMHVVGAGGMPRAAAAARGPHRGCATVPHTSQSPRAPPPPAPRTAACPLSSRAPRSPRLPAIGTRFLQWCHVCSRRCESKQPQPACGRLPAPAVPLRRPRAAAAAWSGRERAPSRVARTGAARPPPPLETPCDHSRPQWPPSTCAAPRFVAPVPHQWPPARPQHDPEIRCQPRTRQRRLSWIPSCRPDAGHWVNCTAAISVKIQSQLTE